MLKPGSLLVCGISTATGLPLTCAVQGCRIASVQDGWPGDQEKAAAPRVLGGPDAWLAPGFWDLQVNGFAGCDFNAGAWGTPASDDLEPLYGRLAASGTALFCPTITTQSGDAMAGALRRLARAMDGSPGLARRMPAIHLEGPWISPEDGPRGAHPAEHVRPPDWDEFLRLQDACGGRIRLVTLAPETPGALRHIERLAAEGITVAIGHTGAPPETIRDAVRAGASVSTHLGNGAHATLPRHPNYIWEQLATDELTATFIADGHHLPPPVLRAMARAKGAGQMALVSDAIALGGLAAGKYGGGRYEVLESGKVVLAGTPYLSGAGHLLDTCVANAARWTGLAMGRVVECVTRIPARLLRAEARKGRMQPGFDADFTLFRLPTSGPLQIAATICAGEILYEDGLVQEDKVFSQDA